MSHEYYDELWLITKNDLEKLLTLDKALQEKPPLKMKRPETIFNFLLPLYLKYRSLVKKLVVCHDQMVQPEKRNLIKKLLDCAIGRMLEYKQEVVKIDFYHYQWPDDVMNRMKITPDDLDIPAPIGKRENVVWNLTQSRSKSVVQRDRSTMVRISSNSINASMSGGPSQSSLRINESIRSHAGIQISKSLLRERAAEEARKSAQQVWHNAILLVQSHERARVARYFAAHMKKQYLHKQKLESQTEVVDKKAQHTQFVNAAIIIQRVWRKYAARLALLRKINQTENMLEMTIPSWQPRITFEEDKKTTEKRLGMIAHFSKQMDDFVSAKRTKLFQIRGPGLIEDITDEIREWFIIWYNSVGDFDTYPSRSLGGSIAIVTGQTLTPQEFLVDASGKQNLNQTDAEDWRRKLRKGAREWNMPKTKNYACLESNHRDDIGDWSFAQQTSRTPPKKCLDRLAGQICYELQLQTREIVDEMMRLELKRLRRARKKDQPNAKSVVGGKKKGKHGKKGGRRKKKKTKSASQAAAMEELLGQLIDEKIVRNYPSTSLSDWQGDMSYQNYEARQEYREHRYRIGEIKQTLREYCVLPLSSKEAHRVAPMTKSLCICGLPKSGKSFLVNAICTEVGALLFDMSPAVLDGKFLGKKNEKRLMEMVNSVSRAYAPSIVFIDGGERPWLKKVPLEERVMRPKRFAPYYPKFVKGIKPGDQILFLTTTSEPYKARKPFVKIHDRFVIIPSTDYNTLYMFYKTILMHYHGVPRDLDVSCLAKMSIGVPLKFIRDAIEKVLALKRRITLKSEPLKQSEIMQEIMMYQAPGQKTLKKFTKFEQSTPLGRGRKKLLLSRMARHEKMAQSQVGRTKR